MAHKQEPFEEWVARTGASVEACSPITAAAFVGVAPLHGDYIYKVHIPAKISGTRYDRMFLAMTYSDGTFSLYESTDE